MQCTIYNYLEMGLWRGNGALRDTSNRRMANVLEFIDNGIESVSQT
jgi:hypothetical protein